MALLYSVVNTSLEPYAWRTVSEAISKIVYRADKLTLCIDKIIDIELELELMLHRPHRTTSVRHVHITQPPVDDR